MTAALSGLFVASFLSATVLPMASEGVLIALLLAGSAPTAALIAVATLGNVLGACTGWVLGRTAAPWLTRAFRLSETQRDSALAALRRRGPPVLLLTWVPFVGDALTVAAGAIRVPFLVFLGWTAAGKLGRYAVVAWLTLAAST